MANVTIYGKTNKKNYFVKIDNKDENLILNTILPDANINEAKEFDKNYIQEDKSQLLYIDLSNNNEVIEKFVNILESTTSLNVVEQNEFNKLQDMKLIYRNMLHFYTLTTNHQKEKLRKQEFPLWLSNNKPDQ